MHRNMISKDPNKTGEKGVKHDGNEWLNIQY
jgi:hypothetical protein